MKNKTILSTIIFQLLILVLSWNLHAQKNTITPKYGEYFCTASKYVNGAYEYLPRGSFKIAKDGSYTYSGFKNPSKGKFTVDQKGNLLFKGGYFDNGKAEKIGRPNKFFLVFPTIPDNRWTCTCSDK